MTNKHLNTLSFNALLKDRIDRNYEDFKEKIFKIDSREVFKMAPAIEATANVHALITGTNFMIDEEDAKYLLQFDNPLKMLAGDWRSYMWDCTMDFEDFIANFVAESKSEREAKIEAVNELYRKHGSDTPLFEVALSELVSLCGALIDYKNSRDGHGSNKGAGSCGEA